MARFGHELIGLHLLCAAEPEFSTEYSVQSTGQVASFRAGGYLALRKWLQPKHRSADDADYHRIATAIARTIEIMGQIDAAIS
jgi:hypothetical protein